jgi:hypothetical protein
MKITVASSYALDLIYLKDKTVVRDGGPALFIRRQLKREQLPFFHCKGKHVGLVEIDLRGEKPTGRTIKASSIILPEPEEPPDLFLLSTLLDEAPVKPLGKLNAIDIQGYVRDCSDFGKKISFSHPDLNRFQIIKATKKEALYLPKELLDTHPLLLITDAEQGLELKSCGKSQKILVEPLSPPDAIGAGDTFFTAFSTHYCKTGSVDSAVKHALNQTRALLEEKIQNQHKADPRKTVLFENIPFHVNQPNGKCCGSGCAPCQLFKYKKACGIPVVPSRKFVLPKM